MLLCLATGKFGGEESGDPTGKVSCEGKRDVEAESLGGPLGWHVGMVGGAVAAPLG